MDFDAVVACALGVDGARASYVFVNQVDGNEFDVTVRAGTLARLLAEGVDWDKAAETTGYALEQRHRVGDAGLGIETPDGRVRPLDLFTFAADPLGSLFRMFVADGSP
jgi:hypothetical protein